MKGITSYGPFCKRHNESTKVDIFDLYYKLHIPTFNEPFVS